LRTAPSEAEITVGGMRVVAVVLGVLALLLLAWIAVEEQYQSCLAEAGAEGMGVNLRGTGDAGGELQQQGEPTGPPRDFVGRIETLRADDCSQLPF
jgi:hypothetical protein